MQTSQVWFYEVPNFGKLFLLFLVYYFLCFEERYVNRLSIDGLQIFSLGKSKAPYTIAAFIKGKKVMEIMDGGRDFF
jgi:hypothetical protein